MNKSRKPRFKGNIENLLPVTVTETLDGVYEVSTGSTRFTTSLDRLRINKRSRVMMLNCYWWRIVWSKEA